MATLQWLRLWHDMPNDPKWRTIARASKQPITAVISVYLHILVDASANATERGRTHSLNSEDVASSLDLEVDQVEAILVAMQGRVLDGEMVSGWDQRQPKREDDSAARARAWREAQNNAPKLQANADRTQPNAQERPDTDTDIDLKTHVADAPVTPNGITISEELRSCFHQHCPTLPRIKLLTPARKQALKQRWLQAGKDLGRYDPKDVSSGLDWWARFFQAVDASDFLSGRSGAFKSSLDWLLKQTNFIKVVEGNYDNGSRP